MADKNNSIILFQQEEIRRTWHNDEWWYCVADVRIDAKCERNRLSKKIRSRDKALGEGWGQIVTPPCN